LHAARLFDRPALVRSIKLNCPPDPAVASVNDTNFIKLPARWCLAERVLLPLFGRNPADETADDRPAGAGIELGLDLDVYVTSLFRKRRLIDLKTGKLQNLWVVRADGTLRAVPTRAIQRNRFGRAQKRNAILTDLIGFRPSLHFSRRLFCFAFGAGGRARDARFLSLFFVRLMQLSGALQAGFPRARCYEKAQSRNQGKANHAHNAPQNLFMVAPDNEANP